MKFNPIVTTTLLCTSLVTPISFSQSTSSQMRFKASVPARCGIEALDSQGELTFGAHYDSGKPGYESSTTFPKDAFFYGSSTRTLES